MSTNPSSISPRFFTSGATAGSLIVRTHSSRSVICIAETSGRVCPATFAVRAAVASRVPPQSGQSVKVAIFSA